MFSFERRSDTSQISASGQFFSTSRLCEHNAGAVAPVRQDRWSTAQAFEDVPQVLATGVVRNCKSEKATGLKCAAKSLGKLCHFHGIANGLVPIRRVFGSELSLGRFQLSCGETPRLEPAFRLYPPAGRAARWPSDRPDPPPAGILALAVQFNLAPLEGDPGIEPMELAAASPPGGR